MHNLSPRESAALAELKCEFELLLGDRLERFVLFGSKARGDHDTNSDIDVAITVRGLDRELRRHILDRVTTVELNHLQPLSTLVLSLGDFERLRRRERRIALDIEREGLPL